MVGTLVGTAASQNIRQTRDTLLLIGTSMPHGAHYPTVGQPRGIQIVAEIRFVRRWTVVGGGFSASL
jgi:hypothetical protein